MLNKLKVLLGTTLFLFIFSANAQTRHYSRGELENMTHARLVEIVLDWQGDFSDWHCTTIDPTDSRSAPTLLSRVNRRGSVEDGSLKWPNGNYFMKRRRGFYDDYSFYYPNSTQMIRRRKGLNDDHTMFWSNGVKLYLANNGMSNHGSIFRPDGSLWLKRNRGWGDDRTRYGLPFHRFSDQDLTTRATLTSTDDVEFRVEMKADDWQIFVEVNSATKQVSVEECYKF